GDSILIDGHSSVSVISLEGAIIFSTGSKSPICLSSGVPQWFTASHFAYLPDEDNHLAVRDVSTQSTVFNIALPDGEVTGVSWSPNHEYALVWIESSQDSFIGSLWLVSLNASTVVMIDDGVPLNCVDVSSRWLNNDIFTFLNATASLSIYSALDSELYSGSEITDLPLTTNITFEHDEEIVYFGSFASEPYGGDALFQYNIRSRDLDEVTTLCDERPIYFDYVSAIDHDRIIFADRLVDFSSQTCRKLPASNIGLPFTAEDVVWQAETHWVLALSEAFEGLYPVYGMDTDEGASRFLTRCEIDSRACYGWLPDLFPELTP
ncbi:MAG: hypothetical protein SGI73_06300, partial [Chloroflexota bacterium]|nr:hypothetical protein [Chloroflexota bacterium]